MRPNRLTMRPVLMNILFNLLWMHSFYMNECHLWINKWFNEWITTCMILLLGRTMLLLRKCRILMFLLNALLTNQPTDWLTDQPMDTAYYSDTRTHLKRRFHRHATCSSFAFVLRANFMMVFMILIIVLDIGSQSGLSPSFAT